MNHKEFAASVLLILFEQELRRAEDTNEWMIAQIKELAIRAGATIDE